MVGLEEKVKNTEIEAYVSICALCTLLAYDAGGGFSFFKNN
jgi:hypothetical protein